MTRGKKIKSWPTVKVEVDDDLSLPEAAVLPLDEVIERHRLDEPWAWRRDLVHQLRTARGVPLNLRPSPKKPTTAKAKKAKQRSKATPPTRALPDPEPSPPTIKVNEYGEPVRDWPALTDAEALLSRTAKRDRIIKTPSGAVRSQETGRIIAPTRYSAISGRDLTTRLGVIKLSSLNFAVRNGLSTRRVTQYRGADNGQIPLWVERLLIFEELLAVDLLRLQRYGPKRKNWSGLAPTKPKRQRRPRQSGPEQTSPDPIKV